MANTSTSRPARPQQQPVVVHRTRRGRSVSLLYLIPAAFVSVLFHAGLFFGMYLLSSPNKAPATESANVTLPDGTVVAKPPDHNQTEKNEPPPPPETKNSDPFLSPTADLDPTVPDADPDINSNNGPMIPEPVVPGVDSKPGDKVPAENGGFDSKNPFAETPGTGLGGLGQGLGSDEKLPGLSGSGLGKSVGDSSGFAGAGIGVPLPGGLDARSGPRKEMALLEGGGTPESELAVERGLVFLVKIQEQDGRWRMDTPSFVVLNKDKTPRSVQIPDRGHVSAHANDVGATALGLLPFLAAGKHHKNGGKDNPFDKPIEKALAYLLRRQDKKTGNLGGSMYNHGLATIAVCEAYGLTRDPLLKQAAQNAINFIVYAQHANGGWRYGINQPGDTSVVGWQIMALKSGQLARLDVPEATVTKAIAYLDSVCDTNNEGYGYTHKGSATTMSAVGLLCRQYIQFWGPNNPRMIKGVEKNIKTHLPNPGNKDIYYYYYATQVMHHFGGQSWKIWNDKMRDQLVGTQVKEGDLAGSWSSSGDRWGHAGGRLMQTSLSLLTLEVYYRHLPLFQQN